jgi:hypothetical protein
MYKLWSKIAAVISLIIGALAIFAGGQVLLGSIPDYYVINWLPVYNYTMGLAAFFVTPIVIWKNSKAAIPAALTTLGLHGLVMMILQTAYRDVVASDSIRAMIVRLAVWLVILGLLIAQRYSKKETYGD